MALSGSPFDTLSRKDAGLESVGAGLREQFVSTRLCLLSDGFIAAALTLPCGSQERDGVVIIREAVTQQQIAQLRESLEEVFSRTDACVCPAAAFAQLRSLQRTS